MNRVIRFRAWNKNVKVMTFVGELSWLVGGLHYLDAGATQGWIPGDAELMQFTGLLDKNGREIFESDLIGYYIGSNDFPIKSAFSIEMSFGMWGFWYPYYKIANYKNWDGTYMERECMKVDKGIGYKFMPLISFDMEEGILLASNPRDEKLDFEVIGNIYENPELLKEAQ